MAVETGQEERTGGATTRRGTRTAAARSRFPEPAYLHIANTIAERIGAGDYRPGDQLPTEAELRSEFGVSPMTVRRAINILLDRYLVTTTQGKGTFVRGLELSEAVFRLQPITEVLDDASVDVSLLEASVVPADEKVAGLLECAVGDHTIFMRRLIGRDGVPLMYQLEQLVYDEHRPLVEAQLQITSLDGLLRSTPGEGMPRGDLAIEAVCLGGEDGWDPGRPARIAGLLSGTSLLRLRRSSGELGQTAVPGRQVPPSDPPGRSAPGRRGASVGPCGDKMTRMAPTDPDLAPLTTAVAALDEKESLRLVAEAVGSGLELQNDPAEPSRRACGSSASATRRRRYSWPVSSWPGRSSEERRR